MSRRAMVVVELHDDGEASYARSVVRGPERSVTTVVTERDGHVRVVVDGVEDETLAERDGAVARALRTLASVLTQ